ncbi:MAG: translation initiation factor IF-3 [Clostridia bacterium]|nr:translation initiation factor IF-3 [Clostridia bacterium]
MNDLCAEFFFAHIFCLLINFSEVFPIKQNNSKGNQINEKIDLARSAKVRLLGPDNEPLGITTYGNALNSAYERDLDLVLIAPTAEPPVCRIMDYGKYKFERDKREKEAKKKQQVIETKEVQLSCRIDTNDFNTKLNRARGFLEKGNKVRVVVRFKGRQMAHQEIGMDLLAKFQEGCADVGSADKKPNLEGRFLSVIILPLKQSSQSKKSKPKTEPKDSAPQISPETSAEEAKQEASPEE